MESEEQPQLNCFLSRQADRSAATKAGLHRLMPIHFKNA